MDDVNVVISVYSIDRANDLFECIASIKKQIFAPNEIIVVLDPDNALIAYYKSRLDPDIKLIVSDAFGLSAARNMGIRNSNSKLVVFIDDDAVAERNWLRQLVSNFDDSSVIGVGGKIIPIWLKKNHSWFPEEFYWIVGCSYRGLPEKKESIRNPIGCNMAFRRTVFDSAGYFSTSMGRVGNQLLGHDDTEFGIRATNIIAGTKILYDPLAIVHHHVSANRVTLKYFLRRSYAEGFSKAFLPTIRSSKSTLTFEKKYLQSLIFGTLNLLFRPKQPLNVSKLLTRWLATVMVLFGYMVGKIDQNR